MIVALGWVVGWFFWIFVLCGVGAMQFLLFGFPGGGFYCNVGVFEDCAAERVAPGFLDTSVWIDWCGGFWLWLWFCVLDCALMVYFCLILEVSLFGSELCKFAL